MFRRFVGGAFADSTVHLAPWVFKLA